MNGPCKIVHRHPKVDVLVGSAGFGELREVVSLPIDHQLNRLHVTVIPATHLAGLLLLAVVRRDRDGVPCVLSTVAFQPDLKMAVYYATKASILSFSEGLHEGLPGTKVNTTCLVPEPTETGFGEDFGMDDTVVFKTIATDAKDVAQAGHDALRKQDPLSVPRLTNP